MGVQVAGADLETAFLPRCVRAGALERVTEGSDSSGSDAQQQEQQQGAPPPKSSSSGGSEGDGEGRLALTPLAKALRAGVSMMFSRGMRRPRDRARFSTRLYNCGCSVRETLRAPVAAAMMAVLLNHAITNQMTATRIDRGAAASIMPPATPASPPGPPPDGIRPAIMAAIRRA